VGSEQDAASGESPVAALYRRALPEVYGYLLPRCGSTTLAEDLTAETFMAAVAAADRERPPEISVGWLVGVARHKLIDHWRAAERERLGMADIGRTSATVDDPWPEQLDVAALHAALARLPVAQRGALTLRYLDGLPVSHVAEHLGRSLHATETLLVRARAALRHVYQEGERDDG
jgi:RNA polymerase sigma-70 factor (ECF subfamily)